MNVLKLSWIVELFRIFSNASVSSVLADVSDPLQSPSQYRYDIGPVTVALKLDSVMSPKRQSKSEDEDTSENILNNTGLVNDGSLTLHRPRNLGTYNTENVSENGQ